LYVDKQAAARAKVSVSSISKELETIFSGRIIGVYHSDYNLEQEYIVLRLRRDLRDNIKDLDKIFISNALGNHVPLSRFVKHTQENQEDVVLNDNRERVVYISGEMELTLTFARAAACLSTYNTNLSACSNEERSTSSTPFIV